VVEGEHPRFLWRARAAAVCARIGGREDGLFAVHFDDDLGIAGDFTGVEGTHADHCSRGDIVSVCADGGTRFREGRLPTLMLSAMVPDGGAPLLNNCGSDSSVPLLVVVWLLLCRACVCVGSRGHLWGVVVRCEDLSGKQALSGRKFNAVQNFGR
jgi:hypothetical protein